MIIDNKLNLRVTDGSYGFVKCFFSKRFSRQTRRDLRTWHNLLPAAHDDLGLLPHLFGRDHLRRRRPLDSDGQGLAQIRRIHEHVAGHLGQRVGDGLGLDVEDVVHSVLDEAERRELESVVLREGLDQRLVHVLLGVLGRVLQRYLKLN